MKTNDDHQASKEPWTEGAPQTEGAPHKGGDPAIESDATRTVEDALRRSAARIHPAPAFVERLAGQLRRARLGGASQRERPRRPLWFAWAGAAVALLLVIGLVRQAIPTGMPAQPPPTALATQPAHQTPGAQVIDGPTPEAATAELSTPEPTEPPFVAELPPAVVTAMPHDGEEVTLQAGILLRFTRPMDRGSVEQALAVTPVVTGTFTWHDDTTVTFRPKVLAAATRYQVSLSNAARGIDGLPLNRDLTFAFSTVGPLTVTHTTPADGTDGLRGDTPLVLAFNYPVVPITCTGQPAEPEGPCAPLPLDITPATSGQGMWVNTSVFRFDPAPAWAAGVTYSVTVPQATAAAGGAALEAPVTFSFTTSEPRVQQITPANATHNVPLDGAVRVTFNTPMATDATERAFSMASVPDGAITGSFSWEDNGTTLVFTPTVLLTPETRYTVVVDAMARSVDGATLADSREASFTAVPALRVAKIAPGSDNQEGRLSFYEGVRVTFNGFVDVTTTGGKIVVRPEDGDAIEANVYWDVYSDEQSAWVSWDKKPGVKYCVVVLPGLADRYGNTLIQEEQACFTVDAMQPIFAPVTRHNALTLDASSPASIYFAAVNLQQITLDFGELNEWDFIRYGNTLPLQSARQIVVSPEGRLNETTVVPVELAEGEPLPTGFYGLTWRAPGQNQYRETVRVAVVDLHALLKVGLDEALVWVTNLTTAEPVAGASVRLVSEAGTVLGSGTSNADGVARFAVSGLGERWNAYTAIVGEPGQPGFGVARTDWNYSVSPWDFDIPYDYGRSLTYRGYLQTDRPIYRPGQMLYFRGILRNDDDGQYSLPEPGTEVEITLTQWDGTQIDRAELAVSEAGTLDGAFELPADIQLGSYRLALKAPETPGETAAIEIAVAAYRKPEFEVTVSPAQTDYLNGETADVVIDAHYYSGGAVDGAKVHWTVRARPATFAPDVPGWWRWGASSRTWELWREPEVVAEGDGLTNAEGQLIVTLPLTLAPLGDEEAISAQRWEVEATVSDEAVFPVTQESPLAVHTSRFYVGLKPQSWVADANRPAPIDLLALDWDAQPVPDQRVRITLARRAWTYVASTEPFRSGTWTHEDTVVETLSARTGADGTATVSVTPPSSGSYVVIAEANDADGNPTYSETYLWVGGPQMAAWQLEEAKIVPVADAERYQAGDVARILLPTPFQAPYEVLMTIERGSILEVRRFTAREPNPVVEIPITEAHVPNVVVTFTAIKGTDARQATPDVRIGMVALEVEPVSQLLEVSVDLECAESERDAAGRCMYEPGDRAHIAIRTRDANGEPVDAEVAVAVVDKAVLALADENAPTLREAFYAARPLGVVTGDGLLVLHNRIVSDLEALRSEALRVAQERIAGGIGGGGGDGAIFAPDVRQDFPDTALWEARIRTGPTGETRVTVRLPDSLTTWVVDARAVSTSTQVGEVKAELVVTKPLLVRPVTPRFFVAGDQAEVAAVVHNNTPGDLDVRVALETDLELTSAAVQEMSIPAQGRARIAWTVSVPGAGLDAARLTFSAEGGGYRDAARPSVGRDDDHALPIYRYETPDVVATSGVLSEADSRTEVIVVPPDAGPDTTLTVRLAPTLAAGVVESLSFLEHFPHACTEQLVSRFLPNVVTFRALRELGHKDAELERKLQTLVEEALAELYKRQNADGGWGWWGNTATDLQTSAYAVLGLINAQRAGFAVDERRLNYGLNNLSNTLSRGLMSERRTLPQALALYVLTEVGHTWPEGVDAALYESRESLEVTARAYLTLALGLSNPEDPRVATLLDSLRADVSLTASGAHWESAAAETWVTWTRATSVVLDVLARLAPDDPLVPQATRWLMVARQNDRWETTQETAWAVMALMDVARATGELEADYAWGLALNGEPIEEGTVTAENLRQTTEHVISIDALSTRWPNALEIARDGGAGTLYYTADLKLYLPAETLQAESRGVTVQRSYCVPDLPHDAEGLSPCTPVTRVRPGDLVEVRLTLVLPRARHYLLLEDFYPAGMEPVDPTLNTTPDAAAPRLTSSFRGWWWPQFDHEELRDERAVFYATRLPAGTYELRYYLRAAIPGNYQVLPATASEMYFPEVWGRSDGALFTIEP